MSAISFINKAGIQTNLQDSIIQVSSIKGIGDTAERSVDSVKIARRDGEKAIGSSYEKRPITLEGRIMEVSAANLRTKLDTVKRDVAGSGILIVTMDGSTARHYNVEILNIIVPEEAYNITWIPLTIVCVAMDSPFGEDPSSTSIYAIDNTSSNIAQTSNIGGSAEPAIDLQLVVPTPGALQSIEIQNTTTNTSLEIARTFDANDVIQVKSAQSYVGLNGLPVKYDGNVVRFDTGDNDWRINFKTSDSFVLLVEQQQQNSDRFAFGTIRLAQSFSLSASAIIAQVDLMLAKIGNPPNITVEIYPDRGFPDPEPGTVATVSTSIMNPISQSASFIPVQFATSVELSAGLWWLVIYVGDGTAAGGGDVNNGIYWKGSTLNPYSGYYASKRTVASAPWIADTGYDHAFRIFKSQTGDSFTDQGDDFIYENLDQTTYKDVDNTTADWQGYGAISFPYYLNFKDYAIARSLPYISTNHIVPSEVAFSATGYPKQGSIDYSIRPNASAAYIPQTSGVWRPFTAAEFAGVLNGALSFQIGLSTYSANMDNWPYVDNLYLYYRNAGITGGGDQLAQSFIPSSSYSLGAIDLMLKKLGTIGNFAIEIQSDGGGLPSGTAITNGTASVLAANVPTTFSWVSAIFGTAPALTSGTKYWIVVKPAASFGSNNYLLWRTRVTSASTDRNFAYKVGAGSWSGTGAGNNDALFRTQKGSGSSFGVNVKLDYKKRWN